ncbi:putative flap endonuclease-1-like 5' DNA nuclease [Halospina denitrificans]|uniref:Putative flap endonuclease-1-like 5' DNA nuclease n=1 Tax=Halospina denitrificans TaxID=332522 RepID=A0A4R7JV63_9GAMM|nr:helix-hairpin-helix domain-containing protein [Halospina denitrificans]TDT41347.1 putative flap endonuclease-1-like 5' DNA nuclease [Halospina denitrificans]
MGKKDKMGVNKVFERVEGLVSDALKRIDSLQNQVQELREQMMERVGLAEKAPKKSAKSTSTSSKTAGKSASSGASTTQKKTSGGSTAKKSSGSKSSGTKSASGAKTKDDLTQIKGVGPATAKKMQAKGITSIKQIANPSADDQKKLEDFKHLKSFSSWQAEARKLV